MRRRSPRDLDLCTDIAVGDVIQGKDGTAHLVTEVGGPSGYRSWFSVPYDGENLDGRTVWVEDEGTGVRPLDTSPVE